MRVCCRLEYVATVLPDGHYYDGPRYQFDVATFCCEEMRRAWDAGIISRDETPAVALAEMTVERHQSACGVVRGRVLPSRRSRS